MLWFQKDSLDIVGFGWGLGFLNFCSRYFRYVSPKPLRCVGGVRCLGLFPKKSRFFFYPFPKKCLHNNYFYFSFLYFSPSGKNEVTFLSPNACAKSLMSRLAINIKYHSVVKALTPFQFIRPRSYHFLALFVCQSVTICFVNFKLKFAQGLSKLPHGFVRQLRGYVTVITFIFQVVACTIFCPLPKQTKLKFEARCYCFRC